jgi:hypothetical protein
VQKPVAQASQAAQKRTDFVILSEAKNLSGGYADEKKERFFVSLGTAKSQGDFFRSAFTLWVLAPSDKPTQPKAQRPRRPNSATLSTQQYQKGSHRNDFKEITPGDNPCQIATARRQFRSPFAPFPNFSKPQANRRFSRPAAQAPIAASRASAPAPSTLISRVIRYSHTHSPRPSVPGRSGETPSRCRFTTSYPPFSDLRK